MLNLGAITKGKQLTLSSGAWLLARYPDSTRWNPEEYEMIHATVTNALEQIQELPRIPDIQPPRRDSRSPEITMQTAAAPPLKVYTDYAETRRHIEASPFLQIVETAEEAEFVLVLKQATNFLKTPVNQFIAQFPYEGGFVRKDLLPLTVRKCCFKGNAPPSWWLPCFDVSTEFHLLYKEHLERRYNFEPNWWILKPGQGCRGQGHKIFFSPDDPHNCSMADLSANCDPFDRENSSDKVAQLLVQNPMLVLGRKFDLRLFVVVRSFCPFDAYVHNNFYARLANKPYSSHELNNSEVALTINAYDKDESIAVKQERLKFDELRNMLLHEAWDLSAGALDLDPERFRAGLSWWDRIVQSVYQCLRELFQGVAPTVGSWPLSRAYYAVDVMLANDGGVSCSVPGATATATAAERTQLLSCNPPSDKRAVVEGFVDGSNVEGVDGVEEPEGINMERLRINESAHLPPCTPQPPTSSSSPSPQLLQSSQTSQFSQSPQSPPPPPPPAEVVPMPVPKLMEVNYMGDWGGMEGALKARDPHMEIPGYVSVVPPTFPNHTFDDWCQDLLRALMTAQELDTTSLFTRL